MSIEHIINAWRDEEYRESLDDAQRAELPESPIGPIDLSESELEDVDGGSTQSVLTAITIAVSVKLCVSLAIGGTCTVDGAGC